MTEPKTAFNGKEPLTILRKQKENYPYFKVHFDEVIQNNVRIQNALKKDPERTQTKINDFKKAIDQHLAAEGIVIEDDRQPDNAHKHSGDKLATVVNAEHSSKL